jgi:hypothetical protein
MAVEWLQQAARMVVRISWTFDRGCITHGQARCERQLRCCRSKLPSTAISSTEIFGINSMREALFSGPLHSRWINLDISKMSTTLPGVLEVLEGACGA